MTDSLFEAGIKISLEDVLLQNSRRRGRIHARTGSRRLDVGGDSKDTTGLKCAIQNAVRPSNESPFKNYASVHPSIRRQKCLGALATKGWSKIRPVVEIHTTAIDSSMKVPKLRPMLNCSDKKVRVSLGVWDSRPSCGCGADPGH